MNEKIADALVLWLEGKCRADKALKNIKFVGLESDNQELLGRVKAAIREHVESVQFD